MPAGIQHVAGCLRLEGPAAAVCREHRPVSRVFRGCGHRSQCRPSTSVQSQPVALCSWLAWVSAAEPADICTSPFPSTEDRLVADSGPEAGKMTHKPASADKEGRKPCHPRKGCTPYG